MKKHMLNDSSLTFVMVIKISKIFVLTKNARKLIYVRSLCLGLSNSCNDVAEITVH